MAEKSRTEYSARNTTVALFARAFAILMGFAARVVFTHTLSEDYVGINGLFTDILSVLALSELGVGTAITYALYRPVAEHDIAKQKSLMRLYRQFYMGVAAFVLVAGLCLIPFLPVLIKGQPNVDHLILIYLMYLCSSVLSYVGIYRRTLIDAHQMSYIGVVYQTGSWAIQNILQIVVLILTHNFILYLAVLIVCMIGHNICITRKANRMYPYLKEKDIAPLSAEEKEGILRNIKAMLMHKVGNVVVNNTDNLLLSALVGTVAVGCYSNYFLIIGSVKQVLEQMFQGMMASVGNMNVSESKEQIRRIFAAAFFMGQWLYGLVAICMYMGIDLFIGESFGHQYVFAEQITLVLCLNFYLNGMRQATIIFRDSMGLFRYDRYKAIAEALINLIVSLALGHFLGTIGVFLGTMVSTVTTSLWVEPYMLYKHRLETSCIPYFAKYACYAGVTFLLWWLEGMLCARVFAELSNPWILCVLRVLVCFVITNAAYLLLFCRTAEFGLLWEKAVLLLRRKLGKA